MRFCELKGEGKENCNRLHHPVLHCLFAGNNLLPLMNKVISREGVLLMLMYVISKNMDVSTLAEWINFYDNSLEGWPGS